MWKLGSGIGGPRSGDTRAFRRTAGCAGAVFVTETVNRNTDADGTVGFG